MSDEFDVAYYNSLFDEKTLKLSAKAFLATEQRIPGLGNGVVQDILLNAKTHPKQKKNALDDAKNARFFQKHQETQKTIPGAVSHFKTNRTSSFSLFRMIA